MELEKLKAEIESFLKKYSFDAYKTPEGKNAAIAEAEDILQRYPDPEGDIRKELAKLLSRLGCRTVVFSKDLKGIDFYRKSLELDPENYDLYWEYYTTLEELVDDDDYRTPDLVQDAITCLTFCIHYCNTPERMREHHVQFRYVDLGRVYMATGDYQKAKECFEKSMEILPNDSAEKWLKEVKQKLGNNQKLGNPITRFFRRLFSVFGKKK